jgi:hypothetical protein
MERGREGDDEQMIRAETKARTEQRNSGMYFDESKQSQADKGMPARGRMCGVRKKRGGHCAL